MLNDHFDEVARDVLKSAADVIQKKTQCSGLDLVNLFMRAAGVLACQYGVSSLAFSKEFEMTMRAILAVEAGALQDGFDG
jgi:hypothetical protein